MNSRKPRQRISDLREALALHLAKLPQDAPIHSVIASPSIEDKLTRFDAADALAVYEQKSYRRLGRLTLWSTMAATVIGALILLPIDKEVAGWPRRVIEASQALALTLTAVTIVWVALHQSVGRWLGARAEAEFIRAEVFRAIMAAAESRGQLPAGLACFKDAQLDWQLGYFRKRGAQHRKASGLTNRYRVLGYLLMAVPVSFGAAGLIVLLGDLGWFMPALSEAARQIIPPQHGRWQLGLGAMASSVLAFAAARSLMDQDDRIGACYQLMERRLQAIRTDDLPAAEAAAAAGDVETVRSFCARVQTILDAEHLSWSLAYPHKDAPAAPKQAV
jgi:hypothetical protein